MNFVVSFEEQQQCSSTALRTEQIFCLYLLSKYPRLMSHRCNALSYILCEHNKK